MHKTFRHTLILLTAPLMLGAVSSCGDRSLPDGFGPIPSEAQIQWQKMETNMFCHFGPNTFTGMEWGNGTEPEDIFNPTDLDCNQWVRVAENAGLNGIIITAKHHDGFCLWPNPMSDHTVSQSVWRNGNGDVLKELSEACSLSSVKMGVYISPWDRNAPSYGTEEYNEVFRKTIEDVHTRYGDIFEQWFDGANGEGPNGKRQIYDWNLFNSEVYKHHPDAMIFSDIGPGCRWVGNERGEAGRTSWSRLDVEGFAPGSGAPPVDTLNIGNVYGSYWIPSETDVSIRPGWFFRDTEKPKTVNELLHIYYSSVGRNSLLLLNVPPDQRGRIAASDSLVLAEWKKALDSIFASDYTRDSKIKSSSRRAKMYSASNLLDTCYDSVWIPKEGDTTPSLTLIFPQKRTFNRVMLQEYIPLGQRVSGFHIDALDSDGNWQEIARETTIGYKRIVLTEEVTASSIRLVIDSSLDVPILNRIALYFDQILDK